jgi:hypothetical protein
MTAQNLRERMDASGLRLAEAELVPFGEIVADVDRIAAWIRGTLLSYADEPATCFAAPRG